MTNRYMKRCSTLLTMREMQIKTTARYCLPPLRMTTIKKSTENKYQRGCGEKGTFLHCWWEWKLVQPLWKTVWRFLRKLKICSGSNTPGHVLRQNYNSKRYMNSFVRNSTIHNSQATEQPKCPLTNEQIKLSHMCTMEHYSAIKNSKIMPCAATWIQPEIIILSEVRKTNIIWYHLYVESQIWHKWTYL